MDTELKNDKNLHTKVDGILHFRRGQSAANKLNNPEITIFAPLWVQDAIKALQPRLKGKTFQLGNESQEYYTIEDSLSLAELEMIARSESVNTSGVIKMGQFPGLERELVVALRDLVKYCVIVGRDNATHYGGYPRRYNKKPEAYTPPKPVYVCDLPGLQFQALDNTGRHVLIFRPDAPPDTNEGLIGALIYQKLVGGSKMSFAEATQAVKRTSTRFLSGTFQSCSVYFDTFAYRKIVAQDFVLAARALNIQASKNNEQICFRFLKYGAGFFAGDLGGTAKDELCYNLALGVLIGIEEILKRRELISQIQGIELPYYRDEKTGPILAKIAELCQKNGIAFSCEVKDALAPLSTSNQVLAITNCSDPHAPLGNEMNYGSVDAAIGENLEGKGHQFNPMCNRAMTARFIEIPSPTNSACSTDPTTIFCDKNGAPAAPSSTSKSGNEMDHGSVNAAIGENLQGKGHQSNPTGNRTILYSPSFPTGRTTTPIIPPLVQRHFWSPRKVFLVFCLDILLAVALSLVFPAILATYLSFMLTVACLTILTWACRNKIKGIFQRNAAPVGAAITAEQPPICPTKQPSAGKNWTPSRTLSATLPLESKQGQGTTEMAVRRNIGVSCTKKEV